MSNDERDAREVILNAVSENGAVLVHCDEWPERTGILTDNLFRVEGEAPVAFPAYGSAEEKPGVVEMVPFEEMSISTFDEGTTIAKFAKRVSRTVHEYHERQDWAAEKAEAAIDSLENRRDKIESGWMQSSGFYEGDVKKMRKYEAEAQAAMERLTEILYLATVAVTAVTWGPEESGE